MLTALPLHALFFDGRKDKTLVLEVKGTKTHRKTVTEEHYVLVQEPGSNYVGHVTPSSGSAANITVGIINYLEKYEIDTSIMAIGCDGTAVNTGQKGGVLRLLEEYCRTPLQWLICQLHGNELPLGHLFQYLDGPTTGPRGFSGPIGGQLVECEKLSVINFAPIESHLPECNESDLSTDQKYLLEICRAVITGNCSEALAHRDPGKVSHSRWLTTANRLLRLYIGTQSPSENLKTLVEYVVKVYTPLWFQIKCNPSCVNGSQNLFELIKRSRYLSDELKSIIDPVIQRNGYFGHPENILLTMLGDERKHIRELALRRILKARLKLRLPNKIRYFKLPPLNFKAEDYIDLISWQDCNITEPPLTFKYSEKELKDMLISGCGTENENLMAFPKLPCHTQTVERCVKLVTEASLAVCGHDARDGFIRSRLESRRLMPKFDTKAQYTTTK